MLTGAEIVESPVTGKGSLANQGVASVPYRMRAQQEAGARPSKQMVLWCGSSHRPVPEGLPHQGARGRSLFALLNLPPKEPALELVGSVGGGCMVVRVYETAGGSRSLIARFIQSGTVPLQPSLEELFARRDEP